MIRLILVLVVLFGGFILVAMLIAPTQPYLRSWSWRTPVHSSISSASTFAPRRSGKLAQSAPNISPPQWPALWGSSEQAVHRSRRCGLRRDSDGVGERSPNLAQDGHCANRM